jgi:hypothetical protein
MVLPHLDPVGLVVLREEWEEPGQHDPPMGVLEGAQVGLDVRNFIRAGEWSCHPLDGCVEGLFPTNKINVLAIGVVTLTDDS